MIPRNAYYKTEHWRERRKEALEDSDNMCDECGSKNNLQVHHKNYFSLFREEDDDLVVLCKSCHEDLHGRVFDIEDDEYD